MSIALGLLLMILFGASLSLGWSMVAATLRIPASHPSASTVVISLASAVAACGFVAIRTGRWWRGGLMGSAIVLFNWGAWIFVSSRFRLPEAISLGVLGVSGNQLLWWLFTLVVGAAAAIAAVGFRFQPPRLGEERPTAIPFVGGVWILALLLSLAVTYGERNVDRSAWVFYSGDNSPAALAAYFRQIPSGKSTDTIGAKHMRALSDNDGTQFDLFLYETGSGVRAGIYDLDQHDHNRGDNRNQSYYGINAIRSVSAIQPLVKDREIVAVFNGASFDTGANEAWTARHSGSLIYKGKVCYASAKPGWTLGFNSDTGPKLGLHFLNPVPGVYWAEYGLSDVQALLAKGRSARNGPTSAMDGVKTSRTSIGWDKNAARVYVLVVREPDAESDSIRQALSGNQSGGWDVQQVRRFWRQMRVPYAVNLSGGDSTQMAYLAKRLSAAKGNAAADGSHRYLPSSGFGLTAGYFNGRPLRAEIPTLPPHLMSRGSLNYIYLYK